MATRRKSSSGAPSAQPATKPIAELWAEFRALDADLAADHALSHQGDDYRASDWGRLFDLERAVLVGPISTPEDAAAKLEAAAQCFENGDLANGADVAAVDQVIAWLRDNP